MPDLKTLKPATGFRSPVEQLEEANWKKQFATVVKFKKKHGILPLRCHDTTLHYWLTVQRHRAKKGKLTEEQLRLYKEAGINILGWPRKADEGKR